MTTLLLRIISPNGMMNLGGIPHQRNKTKSLTTLPRKVVGKRRNSKPQKESKPKQKPKLKRLNQIVLKMRQAKPKKKRRAKQDTWPTKMKRWTWNTPLFRK